MIESPGILLTVLAFVLVIGPLVFVHELGHYAVGRWFGVKADEFSIGFGREVAGFTDKRGTRWKFGWLPLGGYVRFAGDMNPASQPDPAWLALPPAERAQTFQAKPLWQRALIVAAGPFTNFFVAIIIIMALATLSGVNRTLPTVGSIAPGSAAQAAGLVPGDRITALNGRAMSGFDDLIDFVVLRAGEKVAIDFERGGKPMHADTTIGTLTEKDRFGNISTRGLLGIGPSAPVFERIGLLEAPGYAVVRTIKTIRMQLEGLGQIITGRRPIKDMGGPLKIAQVSGQVLTLGPEAFIFFIAFVSINLGFINLLPVPVLDGGHLLLYGIEGVRRRPVEPQVMEWAFRGGLMAILALMLLVTFNDLGAFGVWKNLAGLIG